jgi:hypothetical protein
MFLIRVKKFFYRYTVGQYGCKNLEIYGDFKSKGIFQKKCNGKSQTPKNVFLRANVFFAKQFFKDYLFRSIFLCSFRSEISINLVILKKNKVLSYSRRDSCTFLYRKVINPGCSAENE